MKKIILGLLIFFLLITTALAHKISIFAYVEGNTIKGEVYFNDGSPAKNTKVTLCPVDKEKVLEETKTNQEGSFELPLPKGLSEVKLIAWAEMGHRAEMKLSLKNATQEATSPETTEQKTISSAQLTPQTETSTNISEAELRKIVREEVKKQISPLYQMINELARKLDKPSLSEIFGGIGYIFGLFGLWALLQARKNK